MGENSLLFRMFSTDSNYFDNALCENTAVGPCSLQAMVRGVAVLSGHRHYLAN